MVQSLEYFPSGLIFRSSNFELQPYRFTGKELITVHGLNWYDSKARMQEFQIPHFTSIDPLCEKYYSISPYAYCTGNPVNRIDATGIIT
ncbi:RHS repeat domain-containing protein [Coprobacter sp.]